MQAMKDEAFKEYLLTKYPEEKSARHIRDLRYRCKRVEQDLGVDLDAVGDLTSLFDELSAVGYTDAFRRCLINALNRYQEFKSHL